jgi:predicted nucleic acid-binding protein
MYTLDTNVVSKLRKTSGGKADRNVAAWAESVPSASVFLSAITVLELERGILLLERRDPIQGGMLWEWFEAHVLPVLAGRILAVDAAVAQCCAKLHVPDPSPDRDAFIGATAIVHGMQVVTRNVADFEPMGVKTINPWNFNSP